MCRGGFLSAQKTIYKRGERNMKSQKGITLTSLAIYIVLIFIVLGILATITANMQKGINDSNKSGAEIAEINKFNMYFLQEVKRN